MVESVTPSECQRTHDGLNKELERLGKAMENPNPDLRVYVETSVRYLEELYKTSLKSTDEMIRTSFDHLRRESEAETDRINALRADDVKAVAIANERAVKQAEILATQMATNAETMRLSVEKTATTLANQLTDITSQIIVRIAALEKAQYENQGKTGATDPQLQKSIDLLTQKTEALEKTTSENRGSVVGSTVTMAKIYTAFGAFATLMGLITGSIAYLR